MNYAVLLSQLQQTQRELANEKEKNHDMMINLQKQAVKTRRAQEEAVKLSTELQEKNQIIDDLHVRLETAEIQIEASRRELGTARNNLSRTHESLVQLSEENKQLMLLEAKHSRAMLDQSVMKVDHANLLQRTKDQENIIRDMSTEFEEGQKQLAEIKLQLEHQRSVHEESVGALTRQLEDAMSTIDDLQARFTGTCEEKEHEISKLRGQNQNFRTNIEDLYSCLYEETSKVKLLEEEIALLMASQEESRRAVELSHSKVCTQNLDDMSVLQTKFVEARSTIGMCSEMLERMVQEMNRLEEETLQLKECMLISSERLAIDQQFAEEQSSELQRMFEAIVNHKLSFLVQEFESWNEEKTSFLVLQKLESHSEAWEQHMRSGLDQQNKSLLHFLGGVVDNLLQTLLRCFERVISNTFSAQHLLLQEKSSSLNREAMLLEKLEEKVLEVEKCQSEQEKLKESINEMLMQAEKDALTKSRRRMDSFTQFQQDSQRAMLELELHLERLELLLLRLGGSVKNKLDNFQTEKCALVFKAEQAASMQKERVASLVRLSLLVKQHSSVFKRNSKLIKSDIKTGRDALTAIAWKMVAGVQAFALVSSESENVHRPTSTSQDDIHKSMIDQMNRMNELMSSERKAAEALLVSRLNQVETGNSNFFKIYEKSNAELLSLRQKIDDSSKENAALNVKIRQLMDTKSMLEKELKRTRREAADSEVSAQNLSGKMSRAQEETHLLKRERKALSQALFEHERRHRIMEEELSRLEVIHQELMHSCRSLTRSHLEARESSSLLQENSQKLQTKCLEISILQQTIDGLQNTLREARESHHRREQELKTALTSVQASEQLLGKKLKQITANKELYKQLLADMKEKHEQASRTLEKTVAESVNEKQAWSTERDSLLEKLSKVCKPAGICEFRPAFCFESLTKYGWKQQEQKEDRLQNDLQEFHRSDTVAIHRVINKDGIKGECTYFEQGVINY
eukprot:758493-Hanusia_phi.AAC.8